VPPPPRAAPLCVSLDARARMPRVLTPRPPPLPCLPQPTRQATLTSATPAWPRCSTRTR
jgi:hypothetical protein